MTTRTFIQFDISGYVQLRQEIVCLNVLSDPSKHDRCTESYKAEYCHCGEYVLVSQCARRSVQQDAHQWAHEHIWSETDKRDNTNGTSSCS